MAKFGVFRANFRHYQCVGGPWELRHPNNENFAIFYLITDYKFFRGRIPARLLRNFQGLQRSLLSINFLKFGKMRSRASRVMGFKAKGSDYPKILIVPHTVFPLIETTVLTAVRV